jgi:CPA2 family monovalent cation:H+ antiporter-2
MNHVPTLITDLAIILSYAGLFTLIFKKLRQPLVLGYIVAGFLATKFISFTPSVIDEESVKIWADLGVIFLLFSLGLEFSFKKIMKMGGGTVIATCTISFFMMCIGMMVGWLNGWSQMNCIFLGGMIAMSSTTIIYKAFEDMGLRQKRFANTVLSILILEDILAIVLMVMLTTIAVTGNFEGGDLLLQIGKLVFFLVLWFVVGIYLIPTFFRKTRPFMSDETLLVVALGLCFVMV